MNKISKIFCQTACRMKLLCPNPERHQFRRWLTARHGIFHRVQTFVRNSQLKSLQFNEMKILRFNKKENIRPNRHHHTIEDIDYDHVQQIIAMFAYAYLQSSHTSMMELFC